MKQMLGHNCAEQVKEGRPARIQSKDREMSGSEALRMPRLRLSHWARGAHWDGDRIYTVEFCCVGKRSSPLNSHAVTGTDTRANQPGRMTNKGSGQKNKGWGEQ